MKTTPTNVIFCNGGFMRISEKEFNGSCGYCTARRSRRCWTWKAGQ